MKHQLVLAHKFALKEGLTNKIRVGPSVCLLNILLNLGLPLNGDYSVVNWIKVNSFVFKPGVYITLPISDVELCFAKIKFVVYDSTKTDSEIYLIYDETSTYGFDRHFNGYMKLSEFHKSNYSIVKALNNIPCKPHRAGNGHLYLSCVCINI